MNKLITAARLQSLCVCGEQFELFKKTYGEQVILTDDVIKKVYNKFNWDWLAKNTLDAETYQKYYDQRIAAHDTFRKTRKDAEDGYKLTKDPKHKIAKHKAKDDYYMARARLYASFCS